MFKKLLVYVQELSDPNSKIIINEIESAYEFYYKEIYNLCNNQINEKLLIKNIFNDFILYLILKKNLKFSNNRFPMSRHIKTSIKNRNKIIQEYEQQLKDNLNGINH